MEPAEICGICMRGCPGDDDCLSAPKLNLGSGTMIMLGYINYDMDPTTIKWRDLTLSTDILGRAEDILDIFDPDFFQEIITCHFIEHFRPKPSRKIMEDCYKLLRPGGVLVMEGPDVLGAYEYYVIQKKNIKGYIDCLYAPDHNVEKYGQQMIHQWGWTKDTLAELMEDIGFNIRLKSYGRRHGYGWRDFRVEGVK